MQGVWVNTHICKLWMSYAFGWISTATQTLNTQQVWQNDEVSGAHIF